MYFKLLLLPELELVSPLEVDVLELLSAPLLAVAEGAVFDDEVSAALHACASSSTLIMALLTWPDEPDALTLEFDELVHAVEFD